MNKIKKSCTICLYWCERIVFRRFEILVLECVGDIDWVYVNMLSYPVLPRPNVAVNVMAVKTVVRTFRLVGLTSAGREAYQLDSV
jgi:hypothetical protein